MINHIGENMRYFLLVFSILICLFCLNLKQAHAQNSPAPEQTQPTQVIIPSITPANLPSGGDQARPSTGQTAPVSAAGKYYEYQSYCRSPLELQSYLPEIALTPTQDKILQARQLNSQKKYRDAIKLLSASELTTEVSALIEYSKAYRKLNNLFEAKSALQDALRADKKNANKYLYELCIMETEDSNHGEVEVICTRVSKLFPKDPLPLNFLGVSFRERQNYKEAQKYFERAAQLEKNEFSLTCLGEVHFLQKNLEKAIAAFKASTAVEPRSGRAQLGAAQSLYQLLKYEEALPFFAEACKLDKPTSRKLREAFQPLEAAKLKVAHSYYQAIQKCMGL